MTEEHPTIPAANRAQRRAAGQRSKGKQTAKLSRQTSKIAPPLAMPPSNGATQRRMKVTGGVEKSSNQVERDSDVSDQTQDLPPSDLKSSDRPPQWDYTDQPKRGRGRPTFASVKQSRDQRIYEFLVTSYGSLGMAVSALDKNDSLIIMSNADKCANGWLALGHLHPSVMTVLDIMSGNMAYVVLFSSHVGIVLAIMANHGITSDTWAKRLGIGVPTRTDQTTMSGSGYSASPSGQPSYSGSGPAYASPGSPGVPTSGYGVSGNSTDYTDASAGSGNPQPGAITPELYAMIQAEAERQAQQAQAQAGLSQPSQPNPTHNPAALASMIGRRE